MDPAMEGALMAALVIGSFAIALSIGAWLDLMQAASKRKSLEQQHGIDPSDYGG